MAGEEDREKEFAEAAAVAAHRPAGDWRSKVTLRAFFVVMVMALYAAGVLYGRIDWEGVGVLLGIAIDRYLLPEKK